MTDTIKTDTVTASIAAQTITVTNAYGSSVSVNIKDRTAIPESVNQQDCPILAPRPDDFITNFSVTLDSYGGDAALKTARYTLNYEFFYCPTEQGAGLFGNYGGMQTALIAILLYFSIHSQSVSGITEMLPPVITKMGLVKDIAGIRFHGGMLALTVSQFMET